MNKSKTAYPSGAGVDSYIENPYNIQKWMKVMKSYYDIIAQGYLEFDCFNSVTNGWDEMEKRDFKNWMTYYQENNQNKYKIAQLGPKYYQNDQGVQIPLDHLKAKIPGIPDMGQYSKNIDSEAEQKALKKQETEHFIKAIIGRLNAAERLVTKPEVQVILQKLLSTGLPSWLEALHRLKRDIQTAPLHVIAKLKDINIKDINKHASDILIQDLLFKEANILHKQNKINSATLMYKIAQQAAPTGTPPADVPSLAPPSSNEALSVESPPATVSDDGTAALDELIKGMNSQPTDDSEDVDDADDVQLNSYASIIVTAQTSPEQAAPDLDIKNEVIGNPVEAYKTPQPSISVEEEPEPTVNQPELLAQDTTASDPFESALSNISVVDVVVRLEALANIFRNREIARLLAIIDLMMDKLGIASFFPSLAEASSKSLESNQYALTRIEDILSKLRGSIPTPTSHQVNLSGPNEEMAPIGEANTEEVKQNLQQNQTEDKLKKERRKNIEEAKETQQAPQITNVPEELSQPVSIQPQPVLNKV